MAEEWARRLDTINYEITCGLTARVERALPPRWRLTATRSPSPARRWTARRAWLVGGAVRDRLLGRPTFDLDVVVDGRRRRRRPRRWVAPDGPPPSRSRTRSASGASWRATIAGRSTCCRSTATGSSRPGRARLHRQRDRRAAGRGRGDRPLRRARRPRRRAAADGQRAGLRRRPSAGPARRAARRASCTSSPIPTTAPPRARRAPRWRASRPSVSSPSCKRIVVARPSAVARPARARSRWARRRGAARARRPARHGAERLPPPRRVRPHAGRARAGHRPGARPRAGRSASTPTAVAALLARAAGRRAQARAGAALRRAAARRGQAADPRDRRPRAGSRSSATTRRRRAGPRHPDPPARVRAAARARRRARPSITCAWASSSTERPLDRRTVYGYLRACAPGGGRRDRAVGGRPAGDARAQGR